MIWSASSVLKKLPIARISDDPADLALLAGLTVVDDDDDDPVLLWPDGTRSTPGARTTPMTSG